MTASSVRLKFWGVRGSIATPGRATSTFGGNTSCVEVVAEGNPRLVLDAGTGLRLMGPSLLSESRPEVHILLSHYHWDHMLGLPFFAPIFLPGSRLHIYGQRKKTGGPREALKRQFTSPHFPVVFSMIEKQLHFHDVEPGDRFRIGRARVVVGRLNHPQEAVAYRVNVDDHSVVYASDHEHDGLGDAGLVAFGRDADAMIYDSMFTEATYRAGKRGWGHSTWEEGVRVARAAGIRRLYLFHHDPAHDDKRMAAIERAARKAFPGATAAREGSVVKL